MKGPSDEFERDSYQGEFSTGEDPGNLGYYQAALPDGRTGFSHQRLDRRDGSDV